MVTKLIIALTTGRVNFVKNTGFVSIFRPTRVMSTSNPTPESLGGHIRIISAVDKDAEDCYRRSEAITNVVNWAYRGKYQDVSEEKGWTTERHLLGGVRTSQEDVEALIGQCQMKGPKEENIFLAIKQDSAEIDPVIVGTIHVQRMGEGEAEIGLFSVDPDLQGRGIGNDLLEAAENLARTSIGASLSVLNVLSVRTELIAWYVRKGYKVTGGKMPFPECPDFRFGKPKRQLEFLRLEKNLTA